MSTFKSIRHLKMAAKHSSDAIVSLRHFEDAVRKIKTQRETKPGEPVASLAHYR